jgi:hypothetical protein
MDENLATFHLVAFGALLGEIGGIWLIIWSNRFPNTTQVKRLGKITCISSAVGFLLAVTS